LQRGKSLVSLSFRPQRRRPQQGKEITFPSRNARASPRLAFNGVKRRAELAFLRLAYTGPAATSPFHGPHHHLGGVGGGREGEASLFLCGPFCDSAVTQRAKLPPSSIAFSPLFVLVLVAVAVVSAAKGAEGIRKMGGGGGAMMADSGEKAATARALSNKWRRKGRRRRRRRRRTTTRARWRCLRRDDPPPREIFPDFHPGAAGDGGGDGLPSSRLSSKRNERGFFKSSLLSRWK